MAGDPPLPTIQPPVTFFSSPESDQLPAWFVAYLENDRRTLIMRLGEVEELLIQAGKLSERSITPKRRRRDG